VFVVGASGEDLSQKANCIRVFEKLIVTQLFRKFPAYYVIEKFISIFRKACHCNIS
jgi:hypothetical protein